ncbi:MAG: IS4 family transposase, partial [Cyanobacteria bacterium P01_F01_bin.86]
GLSFLQLGLRELARLCYQRLSLPLLKGFKKCNPPTAYASRRQKDELEGRIEFSRISRLSG